MPDSVLGSVLQIYIWKVHMSISKNTTVVRLECTKERVLYIDFCNPWKFSVSWEAFKAPNMEDFQHGFHIF